MCACGLWHTITLSDDGIAYSFGGNEDGQLGFGHNKDVSLPTPIPNLPQINLVSCGAFFTVCVDYEGFIWPFKLFVQVYNWNIATEARLCRLLNLFKVIKRVLASFSLVFLFFFWGNARFFDF